MSLNIGIVTTAFANQNIIQMNQFISMQSGMRKYEMKNHYFSSYGRGGPSIHLIKLIFVADELVYGKPKIIFVNGPQQIIQCSEFNGS